MCPYLRGALRTPAGMSVLVNVRKAGYARLMTFPIQQMCFKPTLGLCGNVLTHFISVC